MTSVWIDSPARSNEPMTSVWIAAPALGCGPIGGPFYTREDADEWVATKAPGLAYLIGTVPSFGTWMRAEVGANWVVARRSKRIVNRYGEDVVALSPRRHFALQLTYKARFGVSAW